MVIVFIIVCVTVVITSSIFLKRRRNRGSDNGTLSYRALLETDENVENGLQGRDGRESVFADGERSGTENSGGAGGGGNSLADVTKSPKRKKVNLRGKDRIDHDGFGSRVLIEGDDPIFHSRYSTEPIVKRYD